MQHVHIKKVTKEKKNGGHFPSRDKKGGVYLVNFINPFWQGKGSEKTLHLEVTRGISSLSFGSSLSPPRLLLQGFPLGVLERSPSFSPVFIIERSGKHLQGNPPRYIYNFGLQ